ncbi:hypothetical protein HOY80DRAFT_1008965 [Tuber brumale]|nr:hypothetical protein HOY80DRAFT_1008965 [Tuber brumale]
MYVGAQASFLCFCVGAQDPHARAGPAEAEDNVALPQPNTPVHPVWPANELSSSTPSELSEALTLPSSPGYMKVEGDGDGNEAGCSKAPPITPTVRPSTRRPWVDVCADREMVAALLVPDTDPDMPTITNYRRVSQRVRDSAALRSSHIRASSKISSPATRRRSKNTVRYPMDLKKEETEHQLASPGILEDVEMFSLGVGNGIQQIPLAPNKDVMALPTLKRKHEGKQNLGDFAITDSADTVATTGTDPKCVSAKPLLFECADDPCENSIGLGRAQRYSGDKYSSERGTPPELRGMVRKDTMYANGQPTDNGGENYESPMEDEGLSVNANSILSNEGFGLETPSADRSAKQEFNDSPKLLDENALKKQRLDNSQAFELAEAKASGGSNGPDVRDSRVDDNAFRLIDGVLSIPRGCDFCCEGRNFCDRALPCGRCIRAGRECKRELVWVPARPKQQRNKQGDDTRTPGHFRVGSATLPSHPGASSSKNSENSSLQNTSIIRRGRPRKYDVKGEEVKSETKNDIKEMKKVKHLPWSPIDFQKGKPLGIRKPEVWCETRQELCEGLPYYRSYQAGCYGHDGLVHGGGKSGTDENGQRRLLMDQTIDDNTIKYLIKNMNQKWPLVLIMGNQCTNSPSKIPHRYCVMDWFKVTAAWAEKDPLSQCIRWKFRFEKLNANVDGWWAATLSEEPNPPQEMIKVSCPSCEKESPHIYEEGWACLNPNCKIFWMINDVGMPAKLNYTENFLSCRTPWPEDFLQPPNSLAPPLDTELSAHVESGGVSRPFWKGMCCPDCGRLSCRELWAGWLCPACGFSYNPPRTVFDAARLADPHRPVYTGPAIPSNFHNEEINSRRFVKNGMTVVQYQLGDCGTVTHILANKVSNSRHEDANWLLENYQNLDMPFRRFPMKCHHSQGRLLTQQFMYNCGAPYKFIVDVNSLPFHDSPPVVLKALDLIHQRVQLIHPEAQFNEVLNVGYFEKQKMDYHDDGEEGLGETVASISLGGSARMKFRVKSKYKGDRHCWTTEPEKHHSDAGSDNSIYNEENLEDEEEGDSGEIAAGLQTNAFSMRAKGRSNKAMLDLCLNHGDVMVMKGAGIQTHWEARLFRIAATARYIAYNAPESASEKRTIKETETNSDGSASPLTSAKPIKVEDSTMDVDGIQTILANGLGRPDQSAVIGERADPPQSSVELHGPGFATSPAATISQETLPISAVSSPCRGPQGLDTYTQTGALQQLSFPQNMSVPTEPIPPLETTAPCTRPSHQIQLATHLYDMGSPHPPPPTNQLWSYPGGGNSEFLNSPNIYYPPITQPQITPSYHPSPYGQESTSDDRNSYMPQPWSNRQSSSTYPFDSHSSYGHYSPSEVYNNSAKTDNLQNTFSITSQKSNVCHNVFRGGDQGANELRNPLPSSATPMHLSDTSDLFQDDNSNGEAGNPAVSHAGSFTTDSTDKGHVQPF